jgi:hypothetical protein
MGGSLAIIGATALGDALEQHGTDMDAAKGELLAAMAEAADTVRDGAVAHAPRRLAGVVSGEHQELPPHVAHAPRWSETSRGARPDR